MLLSRHYLIKFFLEIQKQHLHELTHFAKFCGDKLFVAGKDLEHSLKNLLRAAKSTKQRNAITRFFFNLKEWILDKLGKGHSVYRYLNEVEKQWLNLVKEAQTNFESEQKNTRPDIDRTDVVFADGGVSYSFNTNVSPNESKAVVKAINDNIDKISENNVFDEKSVDISQYKNKSDYVLEVFNKQGNIATNETIGDVELVKSGAKSTMLHGFGKNKIAAIPAIKSVIENGNIIYYVKNYNNIYDRYIIAARGKIDEKSAIIGVVINSYKSNGVNKFYLHEAEIIEANPSSMTGSPNGEDTVNESASTDIIPTSTEKSQVKFSIPDDSEKIDALWDEKIEKYGAIDENAEIKTPKAVSDKKIVSQAINNILNHSDFTDEQLQAVKIGTLNEEFSHIVYSDEMAYKKAQAKIENGTAQDRWAKYGSSKVKYLPYGKCEIISAEIVKYPIFNRI